MSVFGIDLHWLNMEGSWRVNELSESMWVSVVRLPEIDKHTLIEMEQKSLAEN